MKKGIKEEKVIKGFKGFEKDLKCRGFQTIYKYDGDKK